MVCLCGDDEPALGSERRDRGWGPSPTLLWGWGMGGGSDITFSGSLFSHLCSVGSVPTQGDEGVTVPGWVGVSDAGVLHRMAP